MKSELDSRLNLRQLFPDKASAKLQGKVPAFHSAQAFFPGRSRHNVSAFWNEL
jgi:hypothetical protein